MEYEAVCHRLCDDISRLLLDGPRPPTKRAAFAAGRATQDLAAAFHHAAGKPKHQLWYNAFESLDRFLGLCDDSDPKNAGMLSDLKRFIAENTDLLMPRVELRRAS